MRIASSRQWAGLIHQCFDLIAGWYPDRTAVVGRGQPLTYSELDRKSRQMAHVLAGLGVCRGDRVAICMELSPEALVGIMGSLRVGAAYVPVDINLPNQPLQRLVAGVRVVLTKLEYLPKFDGTRCFVQCMDSPLRHEAEVSLPRMHLESSDVAYVLYTSGSTGEPKGVMVEHGQVVAYVKGVTERLNLQGGDSYLLLQPLSVDSSATMLFGSLLNGGTLHLLGRPQSVDAPFVADYIARHAIDVLKIAPTHLAALNGRSDPRRMMPRRLLILGGEASTWSWAADLARLAGDCRIANHYGPTETTVGVTTQLLSSEPPPDSRGTTPIGRPLPNVRAYVLDESLEPKLAGEVGELFIGGPQVARGYLDQPGVTAERFLPDPYSGSHGSRIYRTGDFVLRSPDGTIHFVGRIDDQVKIRGFRVELGEIRAAIERHPSVEQAQVVSDGGDPSAVHLTAYVVPNSEALDAESLRRWLAELLPAYMIPQSLILQESLPLTSHGKVDRRVLLRARNEQSVQGSALSPIEQTLAELWQELLNVESVNRDSSFFTLGGHSLMAIQMISRVRETLGVDVPLRTIFERPRLHEFAEAIELSTSSR
ncbi:MAG TPA: non-ribosomal peptide synthetase [Bryobacteraceae bacterium]|nr:non-ribosomal peptide synthetase [Bryobacteraceae bacterium]